MFTRKIIRCIFQHTGECGEYLQGLKTSLTSPHYPAYYGSALTCSWVLEAPEGQALYLDFVDVHLSSGNVVCIDQLMSLILKLKRYIDS